MELIELVEVAMTEWDGTPYVNVYEVYEGDFVELFLMSANAYWHTVEWWQEKYPESTPNRRCPTRVTSDGCEVGHWESKEMFYEFIKVHLRGEVLEVVTT